MGTDTETREPTSVTVYCRHCERPIVNADGLWVDPEATGDDSIWRESCDANDTFAAEHEPGKRETFNPYDDLLIGERDGWRVIGHPAAGTASVVRGPRYVNTTSEEDTEPVEIYGVAYRVDALYVIDPDSEPIAVLDRVRGFRVGSWGDLTPAATKQAAATTSEIINNLITVEDARVIAHGRRVSDRETLTRTANRLEADLRVVRGELDKLDAGDNYNAFPELEMRR